MIHKTPRVFGEKKPDESPPNLELPHSSSAESSLLGALVFNNALIQYTEDSLLPHHFFVSLHQKIYEIVKNLYSKGLLASVNTVAGVLSSEPLFQNKISLTEEYLENLVQDACVPAEVEGTARYIADLAMRRQLINMCANASSTLLKGEANFTALDHVTNMEKQLADLVIHGDPRREYRRLADLVFEVIEQTELRSKSDNKFSGLSSGFTDFDRLVGGLQKSDLIIIAGRPSMGKTSLALNVAMNASAFVRDTLKDSSNIAFFSLEMSSEQLVTRLISMKSGINAHKIRVGNIKDDEFNKISLASNRLRQLNLIIDDNPSISIGELRNRARRMLRKEGLALIIVDYLQLLHGVSRSSENNRVNEISEISRGLKALAKELDIPVIALSQLSREVEKREDKKPQLSDLRESGSIEQDSDVVIFIYREEYYLMRKQPEVGSPKHEEWQSIMERIRNSAEIMIAKHRNGPVGNFRLHFDHETTAFKDPINYSYEESYSTSAT